MTIPQPTPEQMAVDLRGVLSDMTIRVTFRDGREVESLRSIIGMPAVVVEAALVRALAAEDSSARLAARVRELEAEVARLHALRTAASNYAQDTTAEYGEGRP